MPYSRRSGPSARSAKAGGLAVPAGVTYTFTGNFENNLRAQARLATVIPMPLALVFLILYFQFRSVRITALVYTGVPFVAAGGFARPWPNSYFYIKSKLLKIGTFSPVFPKPLKSQTKH